MKKIYRTTELFIIDNEEFTVSSGGYFYYLEEEEVKDVEVHFKTWEQLLEFAQKPASYYIWADKTLFKKRDYVRLCLHGNQSYGMRKVYKETFTPFTLVYERFHEVNLKHYSIKDLMGKMKADDFIDYMKDKGITTCPMIK